MNNDEQIRLLLNRVGIQYNEDFRARLREYLSLIEHWNRVVSIVSETDISHLWDRHVVDSLSLAPLVAVSTWPPTLLDIGSGGGFPAIPLKVLFPALNLVMMERSDKKVGFLRMVCGILGLGDIELRVGEFPSCAPDIKADLITARAVERPRKVIPQILRWMPAGSRFFCQSPIAKQLARDGYEIRTVEDDWDRLGLRRGRLHVITRTVD